MKNTTSNGKTTRSLQWNRGSQIWAFLPDFTLKEASPHVVFIQGWEKYKSKNISIQQQWQYSWNFVGILKISFNFGLKFYYHQSELNEFGNFKNNFLFTRIFNTSHFTITSSLIICMRSHVFLVQLEVYYEQKLVHQMPFRPLMTKFHKFQLLQSKDIFFVPY